MRIPGLLVLLLSGWLMATVAAGAQSQSASPPSAPPPATNFDWLQKRSADMAIDQYRLPQNWRDNLDRLATDNVGPARDEVCYTMRSYKVARAERFDDLSSPVEYSTCQPSSRFEVKQAVEPVIDSK